MNRAWILLTIGVALIVVAIVVRPTLRCTPIDSGYTLEESPGGSHRYIVNKWGIKVVGQHVLTYAVGGDAITGTVRRDLGREQIDSFHLDLKTGRVDYEARDGAQAR